MKTILVIASLLLAGEIHAETLNQLRNRVDTWLTNKFPILNNKQDAYFLTHSNYFQGLMTHSSIPAHTTTTVADTVADQLALHPTDQLENWLDVSLLAGENLAGAILIDVFENATGKGWIVSVYVKHNGVTYRRIKAVKGEIHRDMDWHVYNFND